MMQVFQFIAKAGLFPLLAILIYCVLDQFEYYIDKPASMINRIVIALVGATLFCMFWYKVV